MAYCARQWHWSSIFLIFINHLIAVLEQYGVKVKLFADDLKLYLRIVDAGDIDKLQLALNAVTDWENMWQLYVSPSKCCVQPKLFVSQNSLPAVNSCVDLGITVTTELTHRTHINNIVAKAHKRANAIHRCFESKNSSSLLRACLLYTSDAADE